MKKEFIFYAVVLAAACIAFVTWCRRPGEEERTRQKSIANLEYYYRKFPKPMEDAAIETRILTALEQWRNDQVDRAPVLFQAKLVAKSANQYLLYLCYSDEDANLLGIGMREVKRANGTEIVLEERYPLYLEHSQPAVWTAILHVSARVEQVKDETAWSLYMRGEGGYSIFSEKYPTIWLSLPDDEVAIEVFVYDKDGNVSEFVPVEYQRRGTDADTHNPEVLTQIYTDLH